MWNLVLVRLETVLVSVQDRHGLNQMYHRVRNCFGRSDGMLGYVGHVESCFGPFGDGVSVGAR